MQLVAPSLLVALLLAAGPGPHHVLGARLKLFATDFQCPPECAECCQPEHWLAWGEFKCLLKDASKAREALASKDLEKSLVAGRTCHNLKQRSVESHKEIANSNEFKIACKYNANEEKAPLQCSTRFRCCCKEDNNWSENRCFDSNEQSVQSSSNRANATTETYEKVSDVKGNFGKCKGSGPHIPYQVPPAENQNPGDKTVGNVNVGCCLETKRKIIRHHWQTTTMQMGNPPRTKIEREHKDKTYTVCKSHESLYMCSSDGGITSDGKHAYVRVPGPVDGICIGNNQPDPVLGLSSSYRCPASTFGGSWCVCNTDGRHCR